MGDRKKKSRLEGSPSQLHGFYALRQLSTNNSDDDGGGDSNGVRCSMTAQNSNRSMDTVGSIHMDNSRSRTDNNHIGKLDNQIRFQLPRYLQRPER